MGEPVSNDQASAFLPFFIVQAGSGSSLTYGQHIRGLHSGGSAIRWEP